MEFDKRFVYTSLNAEELEAGDEVILANYLESLKDQVEANSWPTYVKRLDDVMGASSTNRFKSGHKTYNLAYLVGKVEATENEKKWIAYLARSKDGKGCYLTACREDAWEEVQETYGAKTKLFVGAYDEAVNWYRDRQKLIQTIEAFEDGKEIQVKAFAGLWYPASNPDWNVDAEYRIKPDAYVAYVDHYEPHLDFGSCAQWDKIQEYKGAKNKLFVGSVEECRAWCDSRDKFADVILAWENGEEVQVAPKGTNKWVDLHCEPTWDLRDEYRVKPDGLVWTDLKMGDTLWREVDLPAPLGGRGEYAHVEERRMVTGIVDDPGTKRHVQLGGDWIDDEDLKKWSVEE